MMIEIYDSIFRLVSYHPDMEVNIYFYGLMLLFVVALAWIWVSSRTTKTLVISIFIVGTSVATLLPLRVGVLVALLPLVTILLWGYYYLCSYAFIDVCRVQAKKIFINLLSLDIIIVFATVVLSRFGKISHWGWSLSVVPDKLQIGEVDSAGVVYFWIITLALVVKCYHIFLMTWQWKDKLSEEYVVGWVLCSMYIAMFFSLLFRAQMFFPQSGLSKMLFMALVLAVLFGLSGLLVLERLISRVILVGFCFVMWCLVGLSVAGHLEMVWLNVVVALMVSWLLAFCFTRWAEHEITIRTSLGSTPFILPIVLCFLMILPIPYAIHADGVLLLITQIVETGGILEVIWVSLIALMTSIHTAWFGSVLRNAFVAKQKYYDDQASHSLFGGLTILLAALLLVVILGLGPMAHIFAKFATFDAAIVKRWLAFEVPNPWWIYVYIGVVGLWLTIFIKGEFHITINQRGRRCEWFWLRNVHPDSDKKTRMNNFYNTYAPKSVYIVPRTVFRYMIWIIRSLENILMTLVKYQQREESVLLMVAVLILVLVVRALSQ